MKKTLSGIEPIRLGKSESGVPERVEDYLDGKLLEAWKLRMIF